MTISDYFQQLNAEMEGDHSNEFCVLLLSDYEWSSGAKSKWNTGSHSNLLPDTNWTTFFERMKTALNSPEMSKYVVTDFGPNTTIGDIKGKILVKFVPNYNVAAAASEVGSLDGTNALFNAWVTGITSRVYYSPLKWATTDGININNNTNSSNQPNPMLYVHTEQANPLDDLDNIGGIPWSSSVANQITAYNSIYNSDEAHRHNVFGMTFLGGNGCRYRGYTGNREVSTDQVADHFNGIWTTAVNGFTGDAANKPYGWVLFNCVGSNASTTTAISKVIQQNVKEGFLLDRDRTKTSTVQYAPSGNTEGTKPGASVF